MGERHTVLYSAIMDARGVPRGVLRLKRVYQYRCMQEGDFVLPIPWSSSLRQTGPSGLILGDAS